MAARYKEDMTHAVVLVKATREALPRLGGELADVDGVAEAYSVTGEWDFVAIVRVPEHDRLAEVVTERLVALDGIERTHTMGALPGFSQPHPQAEFSLRGRAGRGAARS